MYSKFNILSRLLFLHIFVSAMLSGMAYAETPAPDRLLYKEIGQIPQPERIAASNTRKAPVMRQTATADATSGIAMTFPCWIGNEDFGKYKGAYLDANYAWFWMNPAYTIGETQTVLNYGDNSAFYFRKMTDDAPGIAAIKLILDPSKNMNADNLVARYADFDAGSLYYIKAELVADAESHCIYWLADKGVSYDNVYFYMRGEGEINITDFEIYSYGLVPDDFLPATVEYVRPPEFIPESCTFTTPITVSLTADENCDIYYTVNSSMPEEIDESNKYSAPILLSGTSTIRTMAVDRTTGKSSRYVWATYTCTRKGIGEGYNPDSPPDPDVPTENPTLRLVSNPVGAGSFNYGTETKFAENTTINLQAYGKTSFEFVNWTLDGETVSTNSSLTYVMPGYDVTLVANFKYNPNSPADPQVPTVKHPVIMRSVPSGACSFSPGSSFSMSEGEQRDCYAYPKSGFVVTGFYVNGEETPMTDNGISVTMGEKALDIVAVCKYSPVSPSNPNENYYNSETGEVIIDYFTPGSLYSAISNLTGSYNDNVSSVIIKGVMTRSDLSSVVSNYPNAATIDISRTSGITTLSSYAFENSNASTINLPSTISGMSNYIFYNCTNLTSIICHALEPPTCTDRTFLSFTKENCIVYVPAGAVALYVAADYWKDFTILPITDDAHVLQVNLPEDCTDGRYKNNTIEIVNTNTGVRQKYVVSDRLLYTFNGLQKDEQYNVYLYSQAGLEIGRIEAVTIPDEDISVTFENLRPLHNVSATVTAPDGNDVTAKTTVEWYKPLADGTSTYLRKTTVLGDIPEGQELICRVTLDSELGAAYAAPEDTEFTVGEGANICTVNLEAFRQITLQGTVADSDGAALSGATVSASQTLNGKYSKTFTAKTDNKGQWQLTVLDAPQTAMTYAATECVSANDTIGAFDAGISSLDLGKKTLKSIVGARITYEFTYQEAGAEETGSYFSDYQNVTVSVFNITQNRSHNEVSLQYPIIAVLDENIKTGDELRLTAESKTGAFSPIEKTVIVDENQRAETTFDIIGKGGISASFEMTENPAVVGMLYDSKGQLLKTTEYSEAKATFTKLDDGEYTLVTMGQSDLMSSILRLSNFEEIGLTEGKDYVKNTATVTSGRLTEVKNPEIPAFDESLFYYTNSSTNFAANKSSITTGNYLTLRSAIDFKSAYKSGISDVALVVDLPEACDLVEQSVIQGSNLLPYTLDGNRLTIRLGNKYTSQVRFCVIPTSGGTFNASASIIFDYNGKTITQPIGSATSQIKDIEIIVPSIIAGNTFKVSGSASGNSTVNIYEDGALLGNGKANAAGSWNVECELSNPSNLSTHSIYAEITTPAGNTLISESKTLTYDRNALQVSKVTMYHYNPEMHTTYKSVFDFFNPKTTATQWTVYYPRKQFTYTIEFTDNDPERISNVILYVHTADGKFVPVNASFDVNKGMWYAEINMGASPDGYYPVNCSVDFDCNSEILGDADKVLDIISTCDAELGDDTALNDLIETIVSSSADENSFNNIFSYLGIEESASGSIPEDISNFVNSILIPEEHPEYEYNDGILSYTDEDGNDVNLSILYAKCESIPDAELSEFTQTVLTDGTIMYIYSDGNFVKTYYKGTFATFGVQQPSEISIDRIIPRISGDEFFTKWNQAKTTIDALKDINKAYNTIQGVESDLSFGLTEKEAKLRTCRDIKLAYAQEKLTPQQLKQLDLKKLDDCLSKLPKEIRLIKDVLVRLKSLFKVLEVASVINDINSAIDSRREWNEIIDNINSTDCPDMDILAAKARNYRDWTALGYDVNIKTNVASCVGINKLVKFLGSIGIASSLGVKISMATVFKIADIVSWAVTDFSIIQGGVNQINDIRWKSEIRNAMPTIKCEKKNGDNKPGGGANQSGSTPDNVRIDPSGYVYEAVPSNRVEGVQASIYYKETKEDMYGDLYEEEILWDAEEYAQKNPLFTDENGMYRWDVPQGLWQVRFEKDGYQPTRSEWVPVPPPQLDVNIAITQARQPEVTEARAYEEGVEVQFDKFMDISTLTAANIFVTASDEKINGEIKLIDSEVADPYAEEDEESTTANYASRVRFIPEQPLSMSQGEIRLTVSRNVLSYAGIPMTETYSQVLDIEKEVQSIVADDVKVLYGAETELTVYALPYDAAVGRTLRVSNSSSLIASTDAEEFKLDDEGKAVIRVKGEIPGRAQLTFAIDDVTVTGDCSVDVVTEIVTAKMPTASRASGTAVYRGTKITLTTESKNAEIYYTTDGSCPCDENGTRRKYTVPIVINEDMQILAMTSIDNGDEVSDIASFNFTLKRSNIDIAIEDGWTWVSHNLERDVTVSEFTADNGTERILGRDEEAVKDPQYGFVGTLQAMSPTESYKINAATSVTSHVRLSDVEWNPATPIQAETGWNWIGYPVGQTMSVDEAFEPTDAEQLDLIVGQKGFAQFDGSTWKGTLQNLEPGAGYMYQSMSEKPIVYNTSIVSKAASTNVGGISNPAFAVDIHKYPQVMCVIAELVDSEENLLDSEDYQLYAFSDSECRGIGSVVDGMIMMSVYGNTGDMITFKAVSNESEEMFAVDKSEKFSETVLGNVIQPYRLRIGLSGGIANADYTGDVKVSVSNRILSINGVTSDRIEYVALFNTEGKKMLVANTVPKSGISVASLPAGTYIAVIKSDSSYTYHKVMIN